MRLSTHPSQYIVLNSEDAAIRAGAARDVELQAALLDAMGTGPEAVCVLTSAERRAGCARRMDRFEAGLETLSERARERLVIENDDRTFSLADVMELHRRTGLRVVWDILHHHCNDPDGHPRPGGAGARALHVGAAGRAQDPFLLAEDRDGGAQAAGRPPGGASWVLPQLRAHADVIDPIAFEHFVRETAAGLEFDVMLEAKAKDLALLRLRAQLEARGLEPERAPVLR